MNESNVWGFLWDFLVITVITKAIIAHWVAKQLMKYFKKLVGSTERNTAIWTHFQNRAKGNGHASDDVVGCRDEGCQVFA